VLRSERDFKTLNSTIDVVGYITEGGGIFT
jgi:hypothetical protein